MKSSVILVACVLLFGCGGAASAPATPAATPASATATATSADLKAPGEAKVGDRTRCPVSGEEFTVKDDSPHAEYQGKTYYFCCPHCVQKFESDPSKYLGKPST
jgi:YHS domain-containing protein